MTALEFVLAAALAAVGLTLFVGLCFDDAGAHGRPRLTPLRMSATLGLGFVALGLAALAWLP